MLEKIFKKPSLAEQLRTTGQPCNIQHPWRVFPVLKVNADLTTFSEQAPQPGQTIRSVDDLHSHIVTAIIPGSEEGIAVILSEPMPFSVSIHKAQAVGVTLEGKDRFRLSPTNWRDVPAQKDELTFRLPKLYQPDNGELILHDGVYFKVLSTTLQGAFCICTSQEFPV